MPDEAPPKPKAHINSEKMSKKTERTTTWQTIRIKGKEIEPACGNNIKLLDPKHSNGQ